MGMNIATKKKMERFTDLRVIHSQGHANLLCIDPILVYVLPWQLKITGPLEVICTPRVPASSHQGDRELGTCKKPGHANLLQNGAWPLH